MIEPNPELSAIKAIYEETMLSDEEAKNLESALIASKKAQEKMTYKERVFDNPKYMARTEPEKVVEVNLQAVINYNMDWLIKNRPEKIIDTFPRLLCHMRPDFMWKNDRRRLKEDNPEWIRENKKVYSFFSKIFKSIKRKLTW